MPLARHRKKSVHRSSPRDEGLIRKVLPPGVSIALLMATTGALAELPNQDDIALPPLDVRAQRRDDYRTPQSDLFKLPDPIQETPQSITVVPKEVMRQQAIFNLNDALRRVPGISLTAGEGGGAQGDNLTLRGFNARNDLFLDGVRDFGQYSRDTFNLEAVEVLKGPSSVMFGRGSTGGVINQVSKAPQPSAFYGGSITLGTGSFGRGTLDLNAPLVQDVLSARLNVMWQESGVSGRDYVEINRRGVAPSLSLRIGPATTLTGYYLYLNSFGKPDYGLPYLFGQPARVERTTSYMLKDSDHERDDVHILTLRLDHAFTDDVRMRNTSRYAYYHRDSQVSPPRIVGTPAPGTPLERILVNRNTVQRDQTDTNVTNQTDFSIRFDTWGLKHQVNTGVELAHETFQQTRLNFSPFPQTLLVNPDPTPNLAAFNKVPAAKAESDARSAGIYAVDEITLTPHWKVMAGLRYDVFDAFFRNREVAFADGRTDTAWSPRAALVFLPTAMQTYYVSYGTSFNPSAEGLALAANNADAEPETNQSVEIGAKWELLRNRLSLRGAAFHVVKDNARTTDPATGIQENEGKQRVRGFEAEVVGTILPRWNIFAGYTYLNSRILEAKDVASGIPVEGKRGINVPEHTASLWTTVDIGDRWQVGGGAVFVDRRYANNINTNKVPSYARGDATVAFRPFSQFELRMNILNVSNELYFDQVAGGQAVPGAGRTFLFTGTLTY